MVTCDDCQKDVQECECPGWEPQAESVEEPTVEGVLRQLMMEAEWLAGNAVEMSENAETHEDDDDFAEEPQRIVVPFKDMDDVRYKAKRVLVLLGKIREAFPVLMAPISCWCEVCGVHTDHEIDGHEEAVKATEAREKTKD